MKKELKGMSAAAAKKPRKKVTEKAIDYDLMLANRHFTAYSRRVAKNRKLRPEFQHLYDEFGNLK